MRARASRVAGAVFSAVLSVLSGVSTRATPGVHLQDSDGSRVTIKRTVESNERNASATLSGTVYDMDSAVIKGAKIILLNERTKREQTATSNEEGVFRIARLEPGTYLLTIESLGFGTFKTQLALNARESVGLDVTLVLAALMGDIVWPQEEKELKTETRSPQGPSEQSR